MMNACLEKAPGAEQACCLQTPGHPGTHQAYVRDTLLEWTPDPSAREHDRPPLTTVAERAA